VHVPSDSQPQQETTNFADLLAALLGYVVSRTPSSSQLQTRVDISLVARQISLVLVGLIILSSIRLVLRGVTRFLRVTSRNLGASLMLLVLAQLMVSGKLRRTGCCMNAYRAFTSFLQLSSSEQHFHQQEQERRFPIQTTR
jgi:hypothetical protein